MPEEGASFVVEEEIIEDWMIKQEQIVYGGFSMRVIRSALAEKDRETFDTHSGIREFINRMP